MKNDKLTLDEFIENAKNTVLDTWAEKGGVNGMAAVHCTKSIETGEPQASLIVVLGDFADEDAKDGFAAVVRRVARLGDAEAIAFMTEAYTASYDKDSVPDNMRLAGRPEAKEVVVINIEHRDLRGTKTLMADIERLVPGDEESPGRLGPFRDLGNEVATTGRFCNFLPDAGGN